MARFTHDFTGVTEVVWDDQYPLSAGTRHQYGEGPFTVAQVIPVPPPLCNCRREEGDNHLPGYSSTQSNYVGHDQWVEVEIKGEPHRFSGAYFVPALK